MTLPLEFSPIVSTILDPLSAKVKKILDIQLDNLINCHIANAISRTTKHYNLTTGKGTSIVIMEQSYNFRTVEA